MFLQGQHILTDGQRGSKGARFHAGLEVEHGSIIHNGIRFAGMKDARLKMSWREAEAMQCVVGSESWQRGP